MHTEAQTSSAQLNSPPAAVPIFTIDSLIAKGLLPDWLIRIGIRRLLRARLRDEDPVHHVTERGFWAVSRFADVIMPSPCPSAPLRRSDHSGTRSTWSRRFAGGRAFCVKTHQPC